MATPLIEKMRARQREVPLPSPAQARALRQAARLSLQDFAEALDCAPSTVHRWETGVLHPRGALRESYAALLRLVDEELKAG